MKKSHFVYCRPELKKKSDLVKPIECVCAENGSSASESGQTTHNIWYCNEGNNYFAPGPSCAPGISAEDQQCQSFGVCVSGANTMAAADTGTTCVGGNWPTSWTP